MSNLEQELQNLKQQGEAAEWLTIEGLATLSAGYLLPDETPKKMYQRVAKAAGSYYSDYEYWEKKFFDYMWKGWLTPASPILANLGTDRGLPISCLAGDTWLNTRTGGVQIKDVKIGDELLTHKGRYRKVTAKMIRKSNGDLYELIIKDRPTPILVTGNHPVSTNYGWIRVDKLDVDKHSVIINSQIEYVEKDYSFNGVSIDSGVASQIGRWFSKMLFLDQNLGKYGDYDLYHELNKFFPNSLNITESWKNSFLEAWIDENDDWQIPQWILDLPKDILNSFFEVILLDYSLSLRSVDPLYLNLPSSFWEIELNNQNLILSFYNICLRLGISNLNLELGENVSYLRKVNSESKVIVNYSSIQSLRKLDYDTEVFDITVEEDHSFSACGVIFKNCNSIHVGDSIFDIMSKNLELSVLSQRGAGVGVYLGDIRGRGAPIKGNGYSEGVISWAKVYDTTTLAVNQGCYDDQTELLTEKGWIKFEDLPKLGKIKVAQINEIEEIEYVDYTDYIKYYTEEDLYHFKDYNSNYLMLDLKVTADHNVVVSSHRDTMTLDLITTKELVKDVEKLYVFTNGDSDKGQCWNIIGKADRFTPGKNEKIKIDIVPYKGYVYCVSVPSKILLVRRNASPILSGNSTRRGATALYLPIDHPDIEEFLQIRRPTGDINRRCLNVHHGVCITNSWLEEMLAGDENKRRLWEEILKQRVETGEPYLFFSDNVNEQNPECYKTNNLKVSTSNICCLAGDTLVLTSDDPQRIDSLIGKEVTIWDGKNWVKNNTFEQRGEDELIRVYFSGGFYVDSNANHRWFIFDEKKWDYDTVLTKDLKIGQYLEPIDKGSLYGIMEFAGPMHNQIVKIEKLSGIHPVYCPHLPTTGKFALANGLMTGNTEIFLHTSSGHDNNHDGIKEDAHSFNCCLSSLNLAKYHEWKDTDLVETAVRFLDAVLEEYIAKSENIPGLENARRSAIKGRAIGIGVLGWHTLLQESGIPFDSFEAMQLNNEIWKMIRERAEIETVKMAQELGEPEWCKGFNRRHTHLLASAPTVSNSTIAGGNSPSIEPWAANIFVQKSAKGTFIRKNRTLEKLLEIKGKNTSEVWRSINEKQGSVQHLSFLTKEEKEVFLTAREINQHAIIKQAAQRQKYIDQGQSINLFFTVNADPKYIHEVHLEAWKLGLKSLYYLRSEGVLRGDQAFRSKDECNACEG